MRRFLKHLSPRPDEGVDTPATTISTLCSGPQHYNSGLTAHLPIDVLVTIFWFCLPTPTSPPSPLQAPLLLCGVNRFWREVALSASCLWTTVHMRIRICHATKRPPCECLLEANDALVAHWLENSQSRLLTVSSSEESPVVLTNRPARSLGRLAAVADRWQELNIKIEDKLATTLVGLLKDRSVLQVKAIRVRVSHSIVSHRDVFSLFSKFPQLQRFELESRIIKAAVDTH